MPAWTSRISRPQCSEQCGQRLSWFMLIGMLITAMFLLYYRVNEPTVFYVELQRKGQVPPTREEPGVAYCAEMDAMLVFGGRIGGDIFGDAYVYQFESQTYHNITVPGGFPRRFGACVAKINPNPNRTEPSCRFLVWGGSEAADTLTGASSPDLYVVEIEKSGSEIDLISFETIVDVDGTIPTAGRYSSQCVGFGNDLFIVGGLENSTTMSSLLRFELNDTLTGDVEGTWTEFDFTNDQPRYNFASHVMLGTRWVVYGGQDYRGPGDVKQLSSMGMYNLQDLSNASPGGANLDNMYRSIAQQDSLTRSQHVMGSFHSALFVYGGYRPINENGQEKLIKNDFVSRTRVDYVRNSVSCGTSGGRSYTWCGFTTDYQPSTSVVGVQRGDADLILVRFLDGRNYLTKLQLEVAERRGLFSDARSIENEDDYQSVMNFQYTLIAALLLLILTLTILYRNQARGSMTEFFESANQKGSGASDEDIKALPMVRYDQHGNHIPVKVETDDEGNETIIELDEPLPFVMNTSSSNNNKKTEKNETEELDGEEKSDEEDTIIGDDEGDVCAICLLDFEQGEVLKMLPCTHLFHDDCVDPWLKKMGNCPLCKRHIINDHPSQSSNINTPRQRDAFVDDDSDSDSDDLERPVPRRTSRQGSQPPPNDVSFYTDNPSYFDVESGTQNHDITRNDRRRSNTLVGSIGNMWDRFRSASSDFMARRQRRASSPPSN